SQFRLRSRCCMAFSVSPETMAWPAPSGWRLHSSTSPGPSPSSWNGTRTGSRYLTGPTAPPSPGPSPKQSRRAPTLQGGSRDMAWTWAEVHYATGVANGDLVTSAELGREYFTVENVQAMFGECSYTQAELDE